jgi:DNA polymerase III subunit delta'
MSALVGQDRAERLLARAVVSGRVSHAYLLTGPAGAGKAAAALLFAQAINCDQQPAASEVEGGTGGWRLAPCGTCMNCRRITAGTHPEVMTILPDSKKGQNISVGQAREIRRSAALRAKMGRRRVYVIPNAELFNDEAANCLLKTLEEPGDYITLILCVPSPSRVLPTVLSRCQVVRFGAAPAAEVAALLEQEGLPPNEALALAHASGGLVRRALAWGRDPEARERRQRVLDLFEQAMLEQAAARARPGRVTVALRLAESLRTLAAASGDDRPAKEVLQRQLDLGLTYIRDLLLLTGGAAPALAQNQDRLTSLQRLTTTALTGRAGLDVETVRQAQQLLERNVTPQLVLERMFLRLIG